MKRDAKLILNICLLLVLEVVAVGSVPVPGESLPNSTLTERSNLSGEQPEWQRVNPSGEEFSILTPVAPTLIKQGGGFILRDGGERVLEHRSYSCYAGDFIFFIDSYKAAAPQRLLKDLDEGGYPLKVFESDVQMSGFKAKRYRLESTGYYGKRFSVVTKKHVYLITLASRDEDNDSITRFTSSLILGDKITAPETGRVVDVSEMAQYKSAVSGESDPSGPPGQAFKSREVSRKAVIVVRPEPVYTETARQKRVSGTVVLRAIFGADGQLHSIRVVQGLNGGLTEKAIEAALCLRFFPAEKDGQPASQFIQIEYNFNVY